MPQDTIVAAMGGRCPIQKSQSEEMGSWKGVRMVRDDFAVYADHGCHWLDAFGEVPENDVPATRREEAERHLTEACAYFGLPPMRVRWRTWLGTGVPKGTLTDPDRRAAATQVREEELRLRDQYDPSRWGWVPDHDPRPSAIHLRADLPAYPLAAAVRYAATRAYQVWAGFDQQLEEADLDRMAMELIIGLPKTSASVEQRLRAGHKANVCWIAPDGRKIRPLNPPWRTEPPSNRAMRRHRFAQGA